MILLSLLACPILTDEELAAHRDADGDGHEAEQFGGDDCDDADADAFPGNAEVYHDGRDGDCLGGDDADADGDGYGAEDCDDADPSVHPDAAETDCEDPVDYDCDGTTLYADADGDGIAACIDCDDADDTVTDGYDWFLDTDKDGYGDPATGERTCAAGEGRIADATDCDDTDEDVHPGAAERCGGVDHDCDGEVNEETSVDRTEWFPDADEDGYGNPDGGVLTCVRPAGFGCDANDCDDTDAKVNPDAIEWACNEIDDDCDGAKGSGNIDVPGDFATVEDAMDALVAGDTVCVGAGTWEDRVYVGVADVTIEGAGSGLTTLDAQERESVVIVSGAAGFTLRGVTLLDAGDDNEGVDIQNASDATLEDVRIDGGSFGRGVAIYGSSARLRDVDVIGLAATGYYAEAVGIWIANGSVVEMERVRILDNVIAASESCNGVGLYVQKSQVDMTNVLIANNTCAAGDEDGAYSGAAGVWTQDGSTVSFVNSAVLGNVAAGDPGAAGNVNWTSEGDGEEITIVNSINAAASGIPDPACGGWCGSGTADWAIRYTDTYKNVGESFCFPDPTGEDGNISVDPEFTDPSGESAKGWDLTLLPTSPLIDAGDPGILDGDCSPSDIGVFGG